MRFTIVTTTFAFVALCIAALTGCGSDDDYGDDGTSQYLRLECEVQK